VTRRTVRDESGTRYVLEKRSGEASRVRDPETGERKHISNERLEVVEGESPLLTATGALPEAVVELLAGVPDERALGLLLEIETGGPTGVRTLLSAYDICESDLHGLLAELRAAGLLTETRVAGERGYETTATASEALDALR
jgi:hypothetical protein